MPADEVEAELSIALYSLRRHPRAGGDPGLDVPATSQVAVLCRLLHDYSATAEERLGLDSRLRGNDASKGLIVFKNFDFDTNLKLKLIHMEQAGTSAVQLNRSAKPTNADPIKQPRSFNSNVE